MCITQQWCFASVAIQVSSARIPGCGAPHSHPLRLSPHSQQQSPPQVYSPNPTFQHPDSVHTGRHPSQAGVCRAVARTICVRLALSCLPQTGCCSLLRALEAPLLSQLISAPVRASPDAGASLHLQLPTRGAGPILLPLLFLFPSCFFCPNQLRGDLSCPFRCLRSSASVQQVLDENCSIYRFILHAFVGKGELHILLLLRHLEHLCQGKNQYCHFNNINSSDPRTWDIFPFL